MAEPDRIVFINEIEYDLKDDLLYFSWENIKVSLECVFLNDKCCYFLIECKSFFFSSTTIEESVLQDKLNLKSQISIKQLINYCSIALCFSEKGNYPSKISLYKKDSKTSLITSLDLEWRNLNEMAINLKTLFTSKSLKSYSHLAIDLTKTEERIKMQQTIFAQEKSIIDLNEKLIACETKLSKIDEKMLFLENLDTKSTQVSEKIAKMNEKLEQTENSLQEEKTIFFEIKKSVNELKVTVEEHENRMPTYNEFEVTENNSVNRAITMAIAYDQVLESRLDFLEKKTSKENKLMFAKISKLKKIIEVMLFKNKNTSEMDLLIETLNPNNEFNCSRQEKLELAIDYRITACNNLTENEYVMGCANGNIEVWNKLNHKKIRTLSGGHSREINAIVVVNDKLVTGSNDKNIIIWCLKSNTSQFALTSHTEKVNAIIHVKDNLIASGSNDKTIIVWDIESRRVILTLQGHTGYVLGLLMYDECTLLSVSQDDNIIRLWDFSEIENEIGSEINEKRMSDNSKGLLCLCAINKTNVAVGSMTALSIWNIELGRCISSIKSEGRILNLVKLSSTQVGSCILDSTIIVWNICTMKIEMNFGVQPWPLIGMMKLNNSQILGYSTSKTFHIWGKKE